MFPSNFTKRLPTSKQLHARRPRRIAFRPRRESLMNTSTPASALRATLAGTRRSLAWRLVLPVPLALVAAIAAVWVVVPRMIADNATEEAVLVSGRIATQIKTMRTYYTENVVNKALKEGMKTSIDHRMDPKAIPVPATMIHDLGELLSKQDLTVGLYSKYPFANRRNRQLDAFQQEAWEFLIKNPQKSFSRAEQIGRAS